MRVPAFFWPDACDLVAEAPDITLIDGTISMHEYPLGVFVQARAAKGAQYLVALVVVLRTVQPPLGVVEHAQHEFILRARDARRGKNAASRWCPGSHAMVAGGAH